MLDYSVFLLTMLLYFLPITAEAQIIQFKVDYFIRQSKKQMASDNPDSARLYMQQAEKKAIQSKNADTILNYYGEFAIMLYQQHRYAEALEISKKQLQLSFKQKNKRQASKAYNNMAVQYRNMGDLKLAAKNLILGLEIAEQLRDSVNLKKFYNNLSSVFLDLNDKKNSLSYATKSYEFALKRMDSLQIARSLSNLAISEVLNNKFDEAIAHLLQQATIAKKINDYDVLIDSYINLADVYNKLNQPQKALDRYQLALEVEKQNTGGSGRLYIYYGMANSYFKLNAFKQAIHFLKKALTSAEQDMAKNDLKEVYKLASEISEKTNDNKAALKYWKRYNSLNDSIINASTQEAIQEMEIKYQSSLKGKKLAQQQLQITNKNIELESKNRAIFIAIMIIIVILCASIIIYLINKSKHQIIQLNLLKAQIHPHFLFNTLNNLYSLTLNKSEQASEVVLGLSQILRYILYECNSQKVSLEKEVEIIERYISLERVRYSSRLEINMDLQGNLTGYNIAPLLILPLVENAFKHGISKIEDEGWIKMETSISNGQFTFKISNNKPLDNKVGSKTTNYGNIGLNNIRKRLHMLYHNKYDFRILNDDDVFLVTMKIKLEI